MLLIKSFVELMREHTLTSEQMKYFTDSIYVDTEA